MGEVVKLSDYRNSPLDEPSDSCADSLVPIEFAVGISDRNQCIAKIAEYGVESIHIRMVNDEPEALFYLIGVKDAINLNKHILETESISEEEIEQRIDLIQMLENMNLSMMESMWDSFTVQGGP